MGIASTSVVNDSVVIIDTGASANLVGAKWLEKRNQILRSIGRPQARVKEAFASFRYGDGRIGNVHKAAIIPIAIAGCAGQFMAYVADAEIPALLGKEALETLGAHLNFCQRVLTLEALGADIPLKVSAVGHYLLDVADFPERSPCQPSRERNHCREGRKMHNAISAGNNCLFLMDVTLEIRLHPAGRGGPSLTFSCLEPKRIIGDELHLGGKGFPSLRMDGAELKPIPEQESR